MQYPKYENVFRIDTGRTHGWQVRVQRRGHQHTRFFPDRRLGGADAALHAAVTYRDGLIRRLPGPLDRTKHLHAEPAREAMRAAVTRTGVTGIGFTMKKYSRRTDDRRPYINVYWNERNGRPRSGSYSILKHGLHDALKMACNRLWAERRRNGQPSEAAPQEMFEEAWPSVQALFEQAVEEHNLVV